MIKLGTDNIGKIYLGETEIGKVYLGEDLIYEVGGGPTPPTPEYEEVTLTYTGGHTFTLMGETFTYDALNNRYDAAQNIYPSKIELDLAPGIPLVDSVTYVQLLGGIGTNVSHNEVWYTRNGYKNINIRFDNTKTVQTGNDTTDYPQTIGFSSDGKFFQDGVEKFTFSGTLKIAHINGRPSGQVQGDNITKVRVWSNS